MSLQQKRLAEYLKEHNSASTKELESQLAIRHPDTIVSRLRAIYGYGCIEGKWMEGRNRFGEPVRFMMYTLTDEGRKAIWPEREIYVYIKPEGGKL